ncbi:MAG: cytochrome C oxidase Cbb3 [Eggerthellaceae bacterium]|nr:cytochrome C oxidase Cbb3 [Eggerthellaceae bacterium]
MRAFHNDVGVAKRCVISWVVILALALGAEVFLFNINFYRTLGYEPVNLTSQLDLPKTDEGLYRLTMEDHVMDFRDLNCEVHNLYLDFDPEQPAQNLPVKIQFTDEAHLTFFDSTDYTEGVPLVDVATNGSQSKFINLNTAGKVGSLRIEVMGEDTTYPIYIEQVLINVPRPFYFNSTRFLAVLLIISVVYLFRPKSGIYRIDMRENPVRSKVAIVATVAVEAVALSMFCLYGSNLVGVATSSYNYGAWDGHSIVNTFEVGGDNAQQYAELARSMAEGKLYLEEEPPQWLQEMEDPYDKGARDEAQKQSGEPYLFDVAYHDGHYYVYFGVVPVILFYLPFYLLTGANFPTAIGVLAMAIAFMLGCSALLDRFSRYNFKSVSLGLYLLLQVPLVCCCGILYLVKFPTFYSFPIMCGLAFSVWGLYFWMRGRTSRRPELCYFAGSLCMALVLGCRPQLVLLSCLAFPLFWRPFITEGHIRTREGMRQFACLVAPYLLVGLAIMGYNAARFGSPFNFGANYNLTVNDMTKRGWQIGRLAPALFAYFLQPPCADGVFPFLVAEPFATTYMGQTVKEATFGGIFACLPVLWLLPFAPRLLRFRRTSRRTRTVFGVICVLLASGVIIALLDAEMAGILQRYYADFSFMFLAAVVLLVFIANEYLADRHELRAILLKVLIVLVTLSVAYSSLLCFVPEIGWYSDIYPWAYQNLLDAVLFWT